jgi:hypothetical protein
MMEQGTKVKIKGERGREYFVVSEEPEKDGSLTLYGGAKDPNGWRGYKSAMPDTLTIVKRKKNV